MHTPVLRYMATALTALLLAGCKLIPIQNARVFQTEFYRQYFDVDPAPGSCIPDELYPHCERRALDRATDDLFNEMIGKRNWELLTGRHSLGNIRKELREKKVYIEGVLNFSAYLDPFNHGTIWIDGSGRYFLLREKTEEILLYGDFYVPLEKHPLSDLDNGSMTLGVRLFITLPGETSVFQNTNENTNVRYRVYFDTGAKDHKVYSLDYTKAHDVYLPKSERVIGHLYFERPPAPVKLLDLRLIDWLRNDYATMLEDFTR
ncbi:MAG: hypothetical protein ACRERV_03010 [Methylococcales bacterium]